MTVSLATLLTQATKTEIYEKALEIGRSLGLDVDSWQAGDPTRSLYHLHSEVLAKLEELVVSYIKAGFLDYAPETWVDIIAKQVFNVDVPTATYATCTERLTNTGGGIFVIAAGDLTFKNSTTGKTYHNTSGGTLASGPGTTLDVDIEADEPGSESSADAGEIDELVTTLLKVDCTNTTAAVGRDKQDKETTIKICRAKLDALSPNGARRAYEYVALNRDLTGTTAISRVRSYGNSDVGEVTVYLAGPSGAVAEVDRALVEAAIVKWCTPLCVTPTVLSASAVVVPVTYELWVYKGANKSAAEIEAEVATALALLFAGRPIGGDIIPPATTGYLHVSLIESTIKALYAEAFKVFVSAPAASVALTNGQVPALGTVTATINIVEDP